MRYDEFKAKYMAAPKPRRKPRHIEEGIQTACIRWFRVAFPRYIAFACANGGSRNKLEAINMKRAGVLAGVSDLILVANRAILFVEMKTSKGKQSAYQKKFQADIERLGFEYKICRSLQDFQRTVEKWIKETQSMKI